MNYFLLNKKEDFERGFSHNFVVNDTTIRAVLGRNTFFSRIFDSKTEEMPWQRMKFNVGECDFKVSVYASDEEPKFTEIIADKDMSPEMKQKNMSDFLVLEKSNFNDIFLYGIKGRYLWFCIDMQHKSDEINEISDIFIYFDGENFIKYLPSIYQNSQDDDGFLSRFLMVFQSFYEDINDKIENESQIYNPMNTKYLQFLSELVGLEEIHMWSEAMLRNLIKDVKNIYKIRGTREGLLQIITLFTGGGTFVYEDKQDGFTCVNILIKENYLKEQNTIRKIAQRVVPVGVSFNITVLKDHVLLGSSTYIGVNTRLIQYNTIGLTGKSRLNYTVLGNQDLNLEENK